MVAAVLDRVHAGVPLSRMVVLAGSRPAAQQLRARIIGAVGTSQRGLQVTTVHGWCLQVLHRFAAGEEQTPRLLSAPEQEFRVRELLAGRDSASWPSALGPALSTRGFARQVRTILARTRQLGLDPTELAAAGRAAARDEWQAVADFFGEYLDVLDAEAVIDYSELVHRTRLQLLDESVARRLVEESGTIFCDDFAELDRGMINLLADAHRCGSTVVCFADPDTSVFGFRGADPRAVLDFRDRFSTAGAPAIRMNLTENLRSAPAVEHVLRGIAGRLPHRGIPHPAPPSPSLVTCSVRAELVEDSARQVRVIAELLRRAHLLDGLSWSEMAVLTPSGQSVVSNLARRLAAAGVPVQVAGDEIALADELPVRHLLAFLAAAVQRADGGALDAQQAARLLRSPLCGLDAMGLRRLGRQLRQLARLADPDSPGSPSGTLVADELTGACLVPDEARDVARPDAVALSAEVRSLIRFRRLLAGVSDLIRQRADLPTLLWRTWAGTDWPQRLQAEALSASDEAARAHRDLDAVVALFDLAGREASWAGAKGVRSLIAEVEAQQIPADTARESDPRHDGVSVLTVHRSKGREWRLVVLVGLQEGQWPSRGESGGLLRPDLLGPQGLQLPLSPAERLADERRALLLATSRATEVVVAIAIDDPTGKTDAPSRFLFEFGVPVTAAPLQESAATLTGLVAELRRVTANPSADPFLREQAAAQLAWLAEQSDDAGRPLVPGANPHRWRGLVTMSRAALPIVPKDRPIRLGGSEIEQVLACGRQWFLDRRARGGRPPGVNQVFGTLVHAIMAEAAMTGMPAGELLDRLDEAWPGIAYPARWQSRAELESARLALARYDSWSQSPDHRRVLGVETRFELPLTVDGQDVVLVGTVDRLELDDQERVRVIDFKTSRSAPTKEQAAGMDQLGVYQLAVRLGAFDELAEGRRQLADAQVVYLRAGQGTAPVERYQPSLDVLPQRSGEPSVAGQTWVHDRVARAAAVISAEEFHASPHPGCRYCAHALGCPTQQMGDEQ